MQFSFDYLRAYTMMGKNDDADGTMVEMANRMQSYTNWIKRRLVLTNGGKWVRTTAQLSFYTPLVPLLVLIFAFVAFLFILRRHQVRGNTCLVGVSIH